jgi:hypothetical protein
MQTVAPVGSIAASSRASRASSFRPAGRQLEWVHVDLVKKLRVLLRTVRDEMWKRIKAGLHWQRKK